MDKRFAIFDMDGTLIDSMAYWEGLAGEYLAQKGVKELPKDLNEQIAAMTMTQSAEFFRRELGLREDAATIAAQLNEMMAEHYRRDIPLKAGVADYLRWLTKEGVRCCVASATAEELMESCLARLGVRAQMEFLLSCETVGAGKDSPKVYLEAARRFHALPGEIAVYEDALYAARTAKEAGFYVVGVYDQSAGADWETMQGLCHKTIADFSRCEKEEV